MTEEVDTHSAGYFAHEAVLTQNCRYQMLFEIRPTSDIAAFQPERPADKVIASSDLPSLFS